MRKLLFGFIGIVLVFVVSNMFTSCTYNNVEDLYGDEVCDTVAVSYAATVKGILDANCYACHSQSNAPGFGGSVDLETFAQLSAWTTNGAQSRLLCDIQHNGCNDMPKGGAKMSDCNIAKIEAWILAGAQNN